MILNPATRALSKNLRSVLPDSVVNDKVLIAGKLPFDSMQKLAASGDLLRYRIEVCEFFCNQISAEVWTGARGKKTFHERAFAGAIGTRDDDQLLCCHDC